MRLAAHSRLGLLVIAAIGGGCRPDLGAPPSLIDDFTLLAVRGIAQEPAVADSAIPPLAPLAEARPGQTVRYDVLAVSPAGTIADVRALFSVCLLPKPPAESNSVSVGCATATPPGDAAPTPTFEAAMPGDACSLFGPITPPQKAGEPPLRPRDPDSTGGFYVPVRVAAQDPNAADQAMRTAFALTRVQCNLAGASAEILQAYAKYRPNRHPHLAGAALVAGASPAPLGSDPANSPAIASGQSVELDADFADDASETYLWFDPINRALLERRESLSVSWFVSGGALTADRTGRGEAETSASTRNTWQAPVVTAATDFHLWLVLRDSRGGLDFAHHLLHVVP
jgi:hypothetical protein